MHEEHLDAIYFSGTDPHNSEYLCDHWQVRRFLTGFTGSFGEVVITSDHAGLWTDTRYFLQAEAELEFSGVEVHKLRIPGEIKVSQWLAENLKPDSTLGLDPFSVPVGTYRHFAEILQPLHIAIQFCPGLLSSCWEERPTLPGQPVFELEAAFSGESRSSKMQRIADLAEERGAEYTIITALDDLAWTFNLRGNDIPYNPVFYGFAVVGKKQRRLFIGINAISASIIDKLYQEGIHISDYGEFYNFLEQHTGETVYLDPSGVNTEIWRIIQKNARIIEGLSWATMLKSVKNETELQGFRKVMKKDGVALLGFLWWIQLNIGKITLTEYTAGRKLAEFRSRQPGFMGESFAPIIGYKAHGAIVHLSVNESNALPLEPEGILLLDSGGHYTEGTTDITRTISLGPVTGQQKTDFTLALKGMITLSTAVFPVGTKGMHLDILARHALLQHGLNYGHGTGHGIGHFLNVHEGPASIRQEFNPQEIKAGMVFSNEPGLYRTGQYGVRTENMMVCVEKEKNEFGHFLGFETLSLCPIDLKLLDAGLLNREETEWINAYHQRCRRELAEGLTEELKDFLYSITSEIGNQ